MADEKLSWALQFDLTGQGLSQAKKEIDTLQASLAKGQKALFDFEVQGKKVSFELEGMGQKASKLPAILGGVATAFAALAAGIGLGVRALDNFGDRAIRAAGERQGALRAYTTLLGDAAEAQKEFAYAQGLAAKTDLTFADTVKAQKKLMVAGFRGEDLKGALLATTDVASMAAPEDRQLTMERLGKAFADVQSKGKLQGEELKQFSEAGLGRGLIVGEVAKAIGAKDNAEAEKRISKGEVTAEVGVEAIKRAILAQFGTQKLGQYAIGASGSLTGLISNRDEAIDNLLRGYDAEALPAMKRYKKSLTEQVAALDVNTAAGRNASLTLQHFTDTSLSLKNAWTEFTTGFIESFSSSYMEAVKGFGLGEEGMSKTGEAAKHLGELVGSVGTAAAHLNNALRQMAPLFNAISGALEGIAGAFTAMFIYNPDKKKEFFNSAEINPNYEADKAKMAAEKRAQMGAGRSPYAPVDTDGYWTVPGLDVPASAPAAATAKTKAKANMARASSGGGRGGSGGGGMLGTFHPDYSGLMGGMSFAYTGGISTTPAAMSIPSIQASALTQPVRAADLVVKQTIERVEINIPPGDYTKEEVAQEVAAALRRIGRYARTPSPEIL